jgi:hypothetical protein
MLSSTLPSCGPLRSHTHPDLRVQAHGGSQVWDVRPAEGTKSSTITAAHPRWPMD